MGFFTTFKYWRPWSSPVRVSGEELIAFIRDFERLGVARDDRGPLSLKLMFGRGIDQDRKDIDLVIRRRFSGVILTQYAERDLDVKVQTARAYDEIVASIRAHPGAERAIYRCWCGLGTVTESLWSRLYVRREENDRVVSLDGWGLELMPVYLSTLGSDRLTQVSYLALTLAGPGYCHPFTTVQVRERIELQPEVRAVMELCRKTWPAPRRKIGYLGRRRMRRLGSALPYETPPTSSDWMWGVSESG